MNKKMKKAIESMLFKVDEEGLEQTFVHYSAYEEIDDKEFHKLRNEFLKSYEKLQDKIEDMREKMDE